MTRPLVGILVSCAAVPLLAGGPRSGTARAPQAGASARIDLVERLTAGKLRGVNREVTQLRGRNDAVHVSEKEGPGVIWIEGTEFARGTIELDVRGRDVLQRSFLGVAFHRKDDNTYEAVYLRPFNFGADDATRRQHAVQYMAMPEYDWPRLRKEFPEQFERPVDASVAPADWVSMKLVVKEKTIDAYVGNVKTATLAVRKLGQSDRGAVGLWVGNNSDGDFANLRITAAK